MSWKENEALTITLPCNQGRKVNALFVEKDGQIAVIPNGEWKEAVIAANSAIVNGLRYTVTPVEVGSVIQEFIEKYGEERIIRYFHGSSNALLLKIANKADHYDGVDLTSRYFDLIAGKYESEVNSNPVQVYMRSITGEALRKHAKKGFRVLDIGCGTMMESRQLVGDCFVTGMDASALMLDKARGSIDPLNIDRVEFLKVGAELKQDIGKFDVIFSSFGYLESSNLEQFLTYAESHLSDEGKIIFTLWNRIGLMDILLSIATLKLGYLRRKLVSRRDIPGTRYPLPVHPRLPRNTSGKTLRLEEVSGICVIFPPYNYTRLGNSLLNHRALVRLDRILSRLPLFRYLGDFSLLVMARR